MLVGVQHHPKRKRLREENRSWPRERVIGVEAEKLKLFLSS
jgi:hypothetical protein